MTVSPSESVAEVNSKRFIALTNLFLFFVSSNFSENRYRIVGLSFLIVCKQKQKNFNVILAELIFFNYNLEKLADLYLKFSKISSILILSNLYNSSQLEFNVSKYQNLP